MSLFVQEKALALVAQYAREKNPEATVSVHDYEIEDFSTNRFNWHAIVAKKLFDGMLYEVYFDGYNAELTLKAYIHYETRVIAEERTT